MRFGFGVKAGIVNHGESAFERFTANILCISGKSDENFIRTYPFIPNVRNNPILPLIENELPPHKKDSYIGITFCSHRFFNVLEITSTFKAFPLNKGDHISFNHVGRDEALELTFEYPGTTSGFAAKNILSITDQQLKLFHHHLLDSWMIENTSIARTMTGGFTYNEVNKHYRSVKAGQKLFQLMAAKILKVKSSLPGY